MRRPDTTTGQWKEHPETDKYLFSRDGQMWSGSMWGITSPSWCKHANSYYANLFFGGRFRRHKYNRLIMQLFGQPADHPSKRHLLHIDADHRNCSVDNLLWFDFKRHDGTAEWRDMFIKEAIEEGKLPPGTPLPAPNPKPWIDY